MNEKAFLKLCCGNKGKDNKGNLLNGAVLAYNKSPCSGKGFCYCNSQVEYF